MKIQKTLCLVSALALAGGTAQAQTASQIAGAEAALNFVQRLAATYAVLVARAAVDLTYESLTIDSSGQETVINGLVLRPRLDWDSEGACTISIERIAATSSPDLDLLESVIEVSGATVPAACFDPGTGAMLSSFGYSTLDIDRAAMTLAYHVPSSGADVLISADISDAADITVSADLEYVWFTGLLEGDDPEPVAKLSTAEIVIENAGLWERVTPLLEGQFGDLTQLPQMMGPMLSPMLAGPDGSLGAQEQAFVDNLTAELARFVENGDRIVLTMAPEGGVWLEEDVLATPNSTIAALQPEISAAPLAIRGVIAPDMLATAMAGGEGMDEAARIEAGQALITGVGAPRARAEGIALLAPLAEAWNAEAALLVAEAEAETGDAATAYAMALRAMAGGAAGAIGLADGIESRLSPAEVIAAQAEAMQAWPDLGALISVKEEAEGTGDIAALRRLAFLTASGQGMPRSYREAYYLASLAAAGGDEAAAALRDRLDARFTDAMEGRDAVWGEAADAAASAALTAWTGGIAAQVMDRYGMQ